ncbi:MAG: YkgJ family cysteine cluster protein [Nanoarchaeota archaeon]|nr:YkgJ family cysteine cluster protein [Nanoarchaeota archaeon]MBU4300278.1 YkgJ family cysteine cluster protein [Nanoarchaeota archaeon]MBU4452509.1 YkgJ family cysteine cluster protein [Nanoarchaeota archaeon]
MLNENNWAAKLKRTATAFLPIDKSRKGNCIQCGKCCELPVKCPFLYKKDGRNYCRIYNVRPLNCRKYPRTESEWLTKETCGYCFDAVKKQN